MAENDRRTRTTLSVVNNDGDINRPDAEVSVEEGRVNNKDAFQYELDMYTMGIGKFFGQVVKEKLYIDTAALADAIKVYEAAAKGFAGAGG